MKRFSTYLLYQKFTCTTMYKRHKKINRLHKIIPFSIILKTIIISV
jgi:hypothetical protein